MELTFLKEHSKWVWLHSKTKAFVSRQRLLQSETQEDQIPDLNAYIYYFFTSCTFPKERAGPFKWLNVILKETCMQMDHKNSIYCISKQQNYQLGNFSKFSKPVCYLDCFKTFMHNTEKAHDLIGTTMIKSASIQYSDRQ